MRDLEMLGMELTPDLVLKAPGEIDIAIMTEPTEVTTRWLTTMGQTSALKRKAGTREVLKGIKDIEPTRDVRQFKGDAGR